MRVQIAGQVAVACKALAAGAVLDTAADRTGVALEAAMSAVCIPTSVAVAGTSPTTTDTVAKVVTVGAITVAVLAEPEVRRRP